MERDLFLRKYRIEQEDFDAAGVSWEELTAIADHYATIEGKLREIGKDFVDKYLYDIEKAGIHSYRYRTKAPGHLLEKIIRKKKEQPEKFAQLGVDNYWKYVTDLIGIRVFFLYREDDDEETEKKVVLANNNYTEVASAVLAAIGGKENVKDVGYCATRLRFEVLDNAKVDEKAVKAAGAAGVIRPSKNACQVIIGTKVQFVYDELKKML